METITICQNEVALNANETVNNQQKVEEPKVIITNNNVQSGSETCILFMSNNFRHLNY